eukprot:scaffold2141_cov282-Pinguiococcus_pyrenoidosus.AAC.18
MSWMSPSQPQKGCLADPGRSHSVCSSGAFSSVLWRGFSRLSWKTASDVWWPKDGVSVVRPDSAAGQRLCPQEIFHGEAAGGAGQPASSCSGGGPRAAHSETEWRKIRRHSVGPRPVPSKEEDLPPAERSGPSEVFACFAAAR